jgi:hypothetical protein
MKNWIFAVVAAAAVLCGCGKTTSEIAEAPQTKAEPAEISAYGIRLEKDSGPEDVSALLIKGLDNKDEELLKKLAAVEFAKAEIDGIFRKYGKKSDVTSEQAAEFAVSGWLLTYAFLKEGKTAIIQTEIEGGNAEVICSAENSATGEPRKLKIELLKENGWWKVKHGINTL